MTFFVKGCKRFSCLVSANMSVIVVKVVVNVNKSSRVLAFVNKLAAVYFVNKNQPGDHANNDNSVWLVLFTGLFLVLAILVNKNFYITQQ